MLRAAKRWIRRLRKTRRRLAARLRLLRRWFRHIFPTMTDEGSGISFGLNRCAIVYINLEHRSDRRRQIEAELERILVVGAVRIPAIYDNPPILGCARSHLAALSGASPLEGQLLLVLEDDCHFLVPREYLDAVIEEFARDDRLDVLAIANNSLWTQPISRKLAISTDIQTMAAYVVKRRALGDLVQLMQESVGRLAAGESPRFAANDIVWKQLQLRRFFAIPRRQIAVQRPSFSDIRNMQVDYGV